MRESEPAPLILVYFRQHLQHDFYDRHLLIFYSTDDTQVVSRSQDGSTNTQSNHMEETPTASSEKSQYHKRTLGSKIKGSSCCPEYEDVAMPTAPGSSEGHRIKVGCGFEDGAINMGYWMRLCTLHPCLHYSSEIIARPESDTCYRSQL